MGAHPLRTTVAALALLAVSACGTDEPSSAPEPTTPIATASSAPQPSPPPARPAAHCRLADRVLRVQGPRTRAGRRAPRPPGLRQGVRAAGVHRPPDRTSPGSRRPPSARGAVVAECRRRHGVRRRRRRRLPVVPAQRCGWERPPVHGRHDDRPAAPRRTPGADSPGGRRRADDRDREILVLPRGTSVLISTTASEGTGVPGATQRRPPTSPSSARCSVGSVWLRTDQVPAERPVETNRDRRHDADPVGQPAMLIEQPETTQQNRERESDLIRLASHLNPRAWPSPPGSAPDQHLMTTVLRSRACAAAWGRAASPWRS